ncbi:hypothetical protein N9B98_00245 [bacterium]|nr:hypothetical protein [bacterium]
MLKEILLLSEQAAALVIVIVIGCAASDAGRLPSKLPLFRINGKTV